jgi:signal peptidase I
VNNDGQFREAFWHTWPAGRARRLVALLAAVCLPAAGAGLIVVGRPGRAGVWLALSLCGFALLVQWPFLGLVVGVLVWLASVADAGLSAPRANKTVNNWKVAGLLLLFVAAGAALRTLERSYLVGTYHIPSESMSPTLIEGDDITVDRRQFPLTRGDVIVFAAPSGPEQDFVKRVIALPGDTVSLQDGHLHVNGNDVTGPASPCDAHQVSNPSSSCITHLEQLSSTGKYVVVYLQGARAVGFPLENGQCPGEMESTTRGCLVPMGRLFVMGDNRDNSFDSRHFGPLDFSAVKGRVKGVYFSIGNGGVRWKRLGRTVF